MNPANTSAAKKLIRSIYPSPAGDLLFLVDKEDRVHALGFVDREKRLLAQLADHLRIYRVADGVLAPSIREKVDRYFGGDLTALSTIETVTEGTAFQQQVWAGLHDISAGETTSYGALAKRLGHDDRRAAIDVGAAVAVNPVAIIKPCHRVIASNGGLKGYAYGVHRKRWLLQHESAVTTAADGHSAADVTPRLPSL